MEVVFQVPKSNIEESIPIIKKDMENPFKRNISIDVGLEVDWDKGSNYFEAK